MTKEQLKKKQENLESLIKQSMEQNKTINSLKDAIKVLM